MWRRSAALQRRVARGVLAMAVAFALFGLLIVHVAWLEHVGGDFAVNLLMAGAFRGAPGRTLA